MNAHTPRPRAILGAVFASARPAALSCPVAALARRYAALEDRERELNDEPAFEGASDQRSDLEIGDLSRQLWDACDAIAAQVQWIPPESLEGVYFQFLHLGGLLREITETDAPGAERDGLIRSFHRLNSLALEGLERLGGFDGAAFGKRGKALGRRHFDAVRAIATGD